MATRSVGSGSASEGAKRSYESEPFYVLPGGNIEEEPPQRAIPIEQSLEHARFRLQLTALGDERDPDDIAISGVAWAEGGRSKKTSRQETLHAKFGREGAVQIPLSRMLKTIEQRIFGEASAPVRLAHADQSGYRRAALRGRTDAAVFCRDGLPSQLPARSFCSGAQRHCRANHAGLSFRDSEKGMPRIC